VIALSFGSCRHAPANAEFKKQSCSLLFPHLPLILIFSLSIILLIIRPYTEHAVMSGQASSYYDQNQGFDPRAQPNYEQNGYQQNGYQQQQNYQQQNYQQPNYQQPPESKPPPSQYPENPPPPYSTFDQAFKIEKPKYNDLWAGLLVGSPHSR
jgi:hypothetical protein